jgi:hypothetical protein
LPCQDELLGFGKTSSNDGGEYRESGSDKVQGSPGG